MAERPPTDPPPDDPDDADDGDELGDDPSDQDDASEDDVDGPGEEFEDEEGLSAFDFDLHGEESLPLDAHESALVEQDLVDLDQFEATFHADGYRGVSIFCRDCEVEHYYPWDLLRENLRLLLETGETPVHEPAFDPDPSDYVPWDYARGYADALADAGVDERRPVDGCPSCGLELPGGWKQANFCPRCATPLLADRLTASLQQRGLDEDEVTSVLHEMGVPRARRDHDPPM